MGTVVTTSIPLSTGEAPKANPEEAAKVAAEQQQPDPQGQQQPTEQQPEPQGEAKPVAPSDLTKPDAEAEAAKAAAEAAKSAEQKAAEAATGLDLAPFSAEFEQTGALSEDSYGKLAAKGIDRMTVDTYIVGLQATAQARLTELANEVGGIDRYNSILGWAKGALTDAEKTSAVKMLTSSDKEAAKVYLAGLDAKFTKANGKAPARASGGGGPGSEDVFESRDDQRKAMADPRYRSDAKYRREVEQKSIRSFSAASARKRTKTTASKSRTRSTRARSR